jgi:hypothetical protein
MQRYVIAGVRPGMRFWIEGSGIVATSPVDGAAALTEAQYADLERRGYILIETDEPEPSTEDAPSDVELAALELAKAENEKATAQLARESQRALRKNTQLEQTRATERVR